MSCTSCKKKKPITKLPEVEEIQPIPTVDEIKTLYNKMSSIKGITKDEYPELNKTYKNLFGEDLLFGCGQCGTKQFRKLEYHIKEVLKLQI